MRAPDGVDTELLTRRLYGQGVVIEPGAAFFDPARPQSCYYRLAYSSIDGAAIPQGIRLIAAEINRLA
jgi:GntR family transcriptional regulator/MocR family aminotransferase